MSKSIIKKIAKEWAKGVLIACQTDSFDELIEEGLLTEKEAGDIVEEVEKIADRITSEETSTSVREIVGKYFELED